MQSAVLGEGVGLRWVASHPIAYPVPEVLHITGIALLLLAGLNAAWFHGRDSLAHCDSLARAQTALSMGLWLAAIVSGRWIACL